MVISQGYGGARSERRLKQRAGQSTARPFPMGTVVLLARAAPHRLGPPALTFAPPSGARWAAGRPRTGRGPSRKGYFGGDSFAGVGRSGS